MDTDEIRVGDLVEYQGKRYRVLGLKADTVTKRPCARLEKLFILFNGLVPVKKLERISKARTNRKP